MSIDFHQVTEIVKIPLIFSKKRNHENCWFSKNKWNVESNTQGSEKLRKMKNKTKQFDLKVSPIIRGVIMSVNSSGINALVSVIIPTYNRRYFLERSIFSVLSQTYQLFEIIIVDDCSTDKTSELVFSLKRVDDRIKYVRHERKLGAQAARNTGIHIAKGKWIAFLDSDDEWLPEKLEKSLECAYSQNVSVVHSECYKKYVGDRSLKLFGVPNLSGDVYSKLLSSPGPVFPALMIRKECLEHINCLDEKIVSYQEWDTSIRLAALYHFAFIKEPLFIYHLHSGDTISKNLKIGAQGWQQIVEKHRDEILSYAGRDVLGKHYLTISKKYLSAGEVELGYKFELMALENLSIYQRYRYQLISNIYHIPFFKSIIQAVFLR